MTGVVGFTAAELAEAGRAWSPMCSALAARKAPAPAASTTAAAMATSWPGRNGRRRRGGGATGRS